MNSYKIIAIVIMVIVFLSGVSIIAKAEITYDPDTGLYVLTQEDLNEFYAIATERDLLKDKLTEEYNNNRTLTWNYTLLEANYNDLQTRTRRRALITGGAGLLAGGLVVWLALK